MPQLRVDLTSEKRERAVPGEFGVVAVFVNDGDEPAFLNRAQAAHPALALEIQDADGKTVLMRPPDAPREGQLGRGDPVGPGESVAVEYVGFFDRSQAPGGYRIRYAGRYEPLGGSPDEPLLSEWLEFELAEPEEPFPAVEGLPRPVETPAPNVFVSLWLLILEALHRFVCWLRRLFGHERCRSVITRDVDEARTEVMTDAAPGAEAWNGTYNWRARFRTVVDQANCRVTVTVRVRLVGAITAAQRNAWETAIEADWSNRFKLCCRCCCCRNGYTVVANIEFVANGEDQVVNVGADTTNMGNWGRDDTVAVSHEFGHMLGALDEYYTVDGTAWGMPYQVGAGIMNNPDEDPLGRHYGLVERAVEDALGTSCTTMTAASTC